MDLSFNKLDGTLAAIDGTSYASGLKLESNRISGNIPPSYRSLDDVDILDGNLFECSADMRELPEHDDKKATYECASQSFDTSLYIWDAVLCLAAVVAVTAIMVLFFR